MIPAYAADPLLYAAFNAIAGDQYSLTGTGDDQTNCIRFLWEFSGIWRPDCGAMLHAYKAELHLSGPQYLAGSTAHLDRYVNIGVCVGGPVLVVPGHDYFWQGWRASGSGHCGILRVPPAPDVGPSPKCVRIDARRDPPWARETTYAELAGEYEAFRLVRLLGRDGR